MTTRSARPRAAAPVLVLLAAIFFTAGISRLGLGVAEVIAAEPGTNEPVVAVTDPAPEDPTDLFLALRAREAQLVEAEQALVERQKLLQEAERDLKRQMDALDQAEQRLAATLTMTESAAENDLTLLTNMFENMKPVQAAQLFSEMDTEFAAGFMARMRPDFAGEVMANLKPMQAYAISAVLAGRHARTPKN